MTKPVFYNYRHCSLFEYLPRSTIMTQYVLFRIRELPSFRQLQSAFKKKQTSVYQHSFLR